MTFFYDLNKRLADLAKKQDSQQISESAVATESKFSNLAKEIGKNPKIKNPAAVAATIGREKYGQKAMTAKAVAGKKKANEGEYMGRPAKYGVVVVGHNDGKPVKTFDNEADAKAYADKGIRVDGKLLQGSVRTMVDEAGYSAKAGRAGKDLGKPGKNFAKIAKGAAERYGSKAAGERVAGAVLNKLRGKTEEAATPLTSKQKSFAKLAPPTDKITFADKIAGAKKEVDEMLGDVAAEAIKSAIGRGKQQVADEGNAFTGALAKTPKGGKFKVGGKEFTDDSDLEEGFADMDAWLASREKEKGTGKFDKKERTLPGGMKATTYTRKHEDDVEDDSDAPTAKDGAPKKRGRPMGKPKGPERTTKGAWKHKGERKMADEDLDTDGVMMTRQSNMSSEGIDHGEYNDEAGMADNNLSTLRRAVDGLDDLIDTGDNLPEWCQEKIAVAKSMLVAVWDYMESEDDAQEEPVAEKAPPGAKAERMVKGIKKSLSKDGKLSAKDKAIAYATTWKAKKAGKVEEESTDKEDQKAEKAGKKVAKDIEYDEGNKAKGDNKAEKAGKKVTKDIEYDDKKDKKVKESNKGGYNFGGGVYESFNTKVEGMITEGMSVNISVDEQGKKSISVNATEQDAEALAMLLKMAGMNSQSEPCSACGKSDCGCEEELDENSPDWPTNTETSDNALQYSGGLNGPKSTGQTTVPVIASQLRRQVSMEESVKTERSLFDLYKAFKNK